MKRHNLFSTVRNFWEALLNWLTELFNFDSEDRPQQLIPVQHDLKKPMRNLNHQNYELNLLKLILLIVTTAILMFLGTNLILDH